MRDGDAVSLVFVTMKFRIMYFSNAAERRPSAFHADRRQSITFAIALDSDAHLFSRRLSDSCLSDDQPLELTASLGSQVFDWPWLLGRDCPGRGLCVVGCFEFGVDGGCAPMASTITLRVSLHSRWHPGFRLVSRSHSDSCLSDDQPLELTASLGSQVFNWPRLLGRDCPGGGLSVVALWVAGFWLRRTWLVLRAYRSGGDRHDRL